MSKLLQRTKFRKLQAPISYNSLWNDAPVFYITRIFGLLPFKIQRNGLQVAIETSPLQSLYCFFVGFLMSKKFPNGLMINMSQR